MENFHIFIASCYEGLDIQVPRLIKNIKNIGSIPLNYIHFIVGGCPENKIYFEDDIEIVHVKYRCFEFTPFIYLVNNPDKYNFEYAFFTHDTVNFREKFYEIIKNDIKNMKKKGNFDTMKIENSLPSMNIGIYSKDIILKNKNKLLELSTDSNCKIVLMNLKKKLCDYEDFILNMNNYYLSDNKSINTFKQYIGVDGVISNGLLRYFERIDFIKHQSNAYHIQSIDICKIDT